MPAPSLTYNQPRYDHDESLFPGAAKLGLSVDVPLPHLRSRLAMLLLLRHEQFGEISDAIREIRGRRALDLWNRHTFAINLAAKALADAKMRASHAP